MAGARRVRVRSFGSEVAVPTALELAGWVETRRGIGGDLTSFLLERSLDPQEGVDMPACGGRIYRARILETIEGLDGETLTGDPSPDTVFVEEDVRWGESRSPGLRFSIPAPHLLGIRDGYYHDREEFCEGISACYLEILRAMRDAGAVGHVLVGDRVHEDELERLAGPRIFFHYPDLSGGELPGLLEFQNAVAVSGELLPAALELMDEYDLRHISLVDGKAQDLLAALEQLDPDQISLGGYCRGGEDCRGYWKGLVEGAVIPRQPPPRPPGPRSAGSS